MLSMTDTLAEHLIEAHRIHKKRFIDTIAIFKRDLLVNKLISFNSISSKRFFVAGLDQDARDFKIFSLCQRLIEPGLQDLSIASPAPGILNGLRLSWLRSYKFLLGWLFSFLS